MRDILMIIYLFVNTKNSGRRRRNIWLSLFIISWLSIALSAFLGQPAYVEFFGRPLPDFPNFLWLGFTFRTAWFLAFLLPWVIGLCVGNVANPFCAQMLLKSYRNGGLSKEAKAFLESESQMSTGEYVVNILLILTLLTFDINRNFNGANIIAQDHKGSSMVADRLTYNQALEGSDDITSLQQERDLYLARMDKLAEPWTRNGAPLWECYIDPDNPSKGKHWYNCAQMEADHVAYQEAERFFRAAQGAIENLRSRESLIISNVRQQGSEVKEADDRLLKLGVWVCYVLMIIALLSKAYIAIRIKMDDEETQGGRTLVGGIVSEVKYNVNQTLFPDSPQISRRSTHHTNKKAKRTGPGIVSRTLNNIFGAPDPTPTHTMGTQIPKGPNTSADDLNDMLYLIPAFRKWVQDANAGPGATKVSKGSLSAQGFHTWLTQTQGVPKPRASVRTFQRKWTEWIELKEFSDLWR